MALHPRGIDFVIYGVSDVDRALGFYRDLLGLTVADRPAGGWAELTAGEDALVVTVPPGGFTGPIGFAAVAVPDVRAASEQLRPAGVPILVEPWESGVCWNAMIADPDGNIVRLHERKDGTAG
jgi:predicted enzyme related to lactoylglutathione lyase